MILQLISLFDQVTIFSGLVILHHIKINSYLYYCYLNSILLDLFLRTQIGTILRACGDNEDIWLELVLLILIK